MTVQRQERGWGGHFICADRCLFRRNTLLTLGETRIVVSTVGAMKKLRDDGFDLIGCNRYYETMVFRSNPADQRYHDADVTKEISLRGASGIGSLDADDLANDMHDAAVDEIAARLESGELVLRSPAPAVGGAR